MLCAHCHHRVDCLACIGWSRQYVRRRYYWHLGGCLVSDVIPSACTSIWMARYSSPNPNSPSTRPYCGIQRYENGYTYVKCWSSAFPPTQSILFTSKGETTAAPGLPRLTGSNGPPPKVTSVTSSSTSAINETGLGAASGSSGASAGVIAGSAVGGAVAGILVTLLAVFMTLYFRKRRAMEPEPQYTNVNTVPTPMFSPAGSSGYPPGMVANEMQGIASGLSPPLGAASTRYYSPGTSPSPGFKDPYNGQSHPVEIPVNSPGIHELGSGQGFDQGQRFDIEPRRA